MKYLRQLSIILLIYFIGELLNKTFHLPIPGSVIGMLLLLFSLCLGIIKLEHIEEVSNFFLDHLAFFFLPAGVGLIAYMEVIKGAYLSILSVCLISTVVVMGITGVIVQAFKRGGNSEGIN